MPVEKFIPSVESGDKHFHGIYGLYRIYKQHFNAPFKITPKFGFSAEVIEERTLLCEIIIIQFTYQHNQSPIPMQWL